MHKRVMRRTHVCTMAALFAVPALYVQSGRKVRIFNIGTVRSPIAETR
jgi:hypothetical protein